MWLAVAANSSWGREGQRSGKAWQRGTPWAESERWKRQSAHKGHRVSQTVDWHEAGVNYGTSYLRTHKFRVTRLRSTRREWWMRRAGGQRASEPGCRQLELCNARGVPIRKHEELRLLIQLIYHINQGAMAEGEPDRLTLDLWLLNPSSKSSWGQNCCDVNQVYYHLLPLFSNLFLPLWLPFLLNL